MWGLALNPPFVAKEQRTMSESFYSYLRDAWKQPRDGDNAEVHKRRLMRWRRKPAVHRVEHPTRLDRARELGYKAKQGFVVVRSRIRRGGLRKSRFTAGRRPKRHGVRRITPGKNLQRIAEERAARKHPNLEVLNSYWVGQDGRHKFYEVIFLDPHHPAVQNDDDVSWVTDPSHKNRVERGKTSAGQKGRGLDERGTGAEKVRPSVRASSGHST
jgi:large subunit ribosomal protein L15e